MKELSFALDVEDGWPPVAVEHLWCDEVDGGYVLRSIPFFVRGLAVGDHFTAEVDTTDGHIFQFSVWSTSGNSLVRILDQDGMNLEPYRQEFLALSCMFETFPAFGVNTFDVPAQADAQAINELVNRIEAAGFPIAFPVWRHEPCNVR